MTTTQFVAAAVIALVIVLPLMILLNPPTAWVSYIWGNRKKR
jgi:hypothetical protein